MDVTRVRELPWLRVKLPVVRGVMLRVAPVAATMRRQLCSLDTFRRFSLDGPRLNDQLIPSTELAGLSVLSRTTCRIVGRTYIFRVALPGLDGILNCLA